MRTYTPFSNGFQLVPIEDATQDLNCVVRKLRAAEDRATHWRKVAYQLAGGDKQKIEAAENAIYPELASADAEGK